jgi:hypothetical protein
LSCRAIASGRVPFRQHREKTRLLTGLPGSVRCCPRIWNGFTVWVVDRRGRVPTFASQLSNDQLTHLAQKSVARASRKYSAGFMLAALNETDRLSDDQLRQLVEMPDFGEAVASWYGAYLFFTGIEAVPISVQVPRRGHMKSDHGTVDRCPNVISFRLGRSS